VKHYYQSLSNYLNALSVRERALVLLVSISVIYAVWDGLLLSKQEQHYQQLLISQATLLEQQQLRDEAIAKKTTLLVARQQTEDQKKQAINQAQDSLQATTVQLNSVLNRLVPPTKITELLRSLLLQTQGLKLLSLSNDAVENISIDNSVAEDESQTNDIVKSSLYKHSTTLKLSGNYQQLYQYLSVLENSEWGLYWDTLNYKVTHYPKAEIMIKVHTISTNEYWIGL